MEALQLTSLVQEVLSGSPRAVIAILIISVAVLIFEIKNVRRDYKDLQDRADAQRGDFLKVLNESREQYSKKSEEMTERYYHMLHEVNLNIQSLITLMDRLSEDERLSRINPIRHSSDDVDETNDTTTHSNVIDGES